MTNTNRTPCLRQILDEGRRQRSLATWQMIDAIRTLPARLLGRHDKRATDKDGPPKSLVCAA